MSTHHKHPQWLEYVRSAESPRLLTPWGSHVHPRPRDDRVPSLHKKDARRSQSECVHLLLGGAASYAVPHLKEPLTSSEYHSQSRFFQDHAPAPLMPGHGPRSCSSPGNAPVSAHMSQPCASVHMSQCRVPGYF